jgi:hypothetical protein
MTDSAKSTMFKVERHTQGRAQLSIDMTVWIWLDAAALRPS